MPYPTFGLRHDPNNGGPGRPRRERDAPDDVIYNPNTCSAAASRGHCPARSCRPDHPRHLRVRVDRPLHVLHRRARQRHGGRTNTRGHHAAQVEDSPEKLPGLQYNNTVSPHTYQNLADETPRERCVRVFVGSSLRKPHASQALAHRSLSGGTASSARWSTTRRHRSRNPRRTRRKRRSNARGRPRTARDRRRRLARGMTTQCGARGTTVHVAVMRQIWRMMRQIWRVLLVSRNHSPNEPRQVTPTRPSWHREAPATRGLAA